MQTMQTMRKSIASTVSVVLGFIAASAEPARAQEVATPPTDTSAQAVTLAPPSPWRFDFSAWAWLLGIDGDVGARGQTVSVNQSFADILDESDSIVGLAGRVEIGYDRWGGYLDAFWSDLGADDRTGPDGIARVDVDMEETIIDFGGMFRLAEWTPGGAEPYLREGSLDLYAGARYARVETTIDPRDLPAFSQSRDWIDPVVGLKVVAPFAEHWHVAVNGDIGGFGAASDFTWSATALLGFDFRLGHAVGSLKGGYRAIGWDYSTGTSTGEFTWDVIQHGFLVGFGIEF